MMARVARLPYSGPFSKSSPAVAIVLVTWAKQMMTLRVGAKRHRVALRCG
jgi:hypothetical protein